MYSVKLESASKSFKNTGPVVDRLSLEVESKEFLVLLGASGCGKSTLLRLMAGLETPDSGTVRRADQLSLSYVFQDPNLIPWRNVAANVRLPFELGDGVLQNVHQQDVESRIEAALELVGLRDSANKMPHELSGGMKMRASLARALVTRPGLLLMDEPFAALDEIARFHLQEELRILWRSLGVTIVFVTHSMSEAAFLGTRQIVLTPRPARIAATHLTQLGETRDGTTRMSGQYAADVQALQSRLQATMAAGERAEEVAP